MKIKITTKQVALIAIFSALYAVLRVIPLGPMIGFTGSFAVSDALAPIIGIILGPFTGGLSIIIGTFAAMALGKAPIFMGLDFLPALVNAVAVGFLIRQKRIRVIALFAVILTIFLVSPYTLLMVQVGSVAIPFMWLHIVALLILISPLCSKAIINIRKTNVAYLAISIAVLAFIGTMLQHLTGNLLFQLMFGQPIGGYTAVTFAGYWNLIFFAYPVERLVMVIIATVIGVSLVKLLKKSALPFEDPTTDKALKEKPQ